MSVSLSDPSISTEPPEPPKNGFDLATALAVDLTEGVEVALFTDSVEQAELGEAFRWSPKASAYPVWGVLGSWGRRLLDLIVEPAEDVKWWKVKQYAKTVGADLVPVRYEGAIIDIPEKYFSPGTFLGVRLYSSGPWFWPLEKPTIKVPEDGELQTMADKMNILAGYTNKSNDPNDSNNS